MVVTILAILCFIVLGFITVDPDSLVSVRGLAIVDAKDVIRLVPDGDNPIVIGSPRANAIS